MLAFCFGQRRSDSQSEIIRVHVRGVGISKKIEKCPKLHQNVQRNPSFARTGIITDDGRNLVPSRWVLKVGKSDSSLPNERLTVLLRALVCLKGLKKSQCLMRLKGRGVRLLNRSITGTSIHFISRLAVRVAMVVRKLLL
jgi:hypothetical protein